MTIIERFTELLRSESQARQSQSAAGQGARAPAKDIIERAAGDIVRRLDPAQAKDFPANATASGVARPASRSVRTLRIDRERLRKQGMIVPDGGRTPIAESFRRVKRRILENVASRGTEWPPANLVLVTSALPGEGKTFCAINLAISMALELDHTVLLVDADVAKPSVLKELGLKAEKGLMDVLVARGTNVSDVECGTDIEKLAILPAGTAHQHATELLASDTLRGLLRELAGRHRDRIIIFDSSPLLAASETSALAKQMGQIIVVVEAGKTIESALKEALGRLDSTKVTGLLLNKGEAHRLAYGYGYGYGGHG